MFSSTRSDLDFPERTNRGDEESDQGDEQARKREHHPRSWRPADQISIMAGPRKSPISLAIEY
jgi:hypothetical protein